MSFSCHFRGKPPTWKFSRSNTNNHMVILTPKYSNLIIHTVTMDYAGPIGCSANSIEYSLKFVGKVV